jgi:hypothetical protein
MASSIESYISLSIYIISCFSFYSFSITATNSVYKSARMSDVKSIIEAVSIVIDNLHPGERVRFYLHQTYSNIYLNGTHVIADEPFRFAVRLDIPTNILVLKPSEEYTAFNVDGRVEIESV